MLAASALAVRCDLCVQGMAFLLLRANMGEGVSSFAFAS
jgi:hypothetical protein